MSRQRFWHVLRFQSPLRNFDVRRGARRGLLGSDCCSYGSPDRLSCRDRRRFSLREILGGLVKVHAAHLARLVQAHQDLCPLGPAFRPVSVEDLAGRGKGPQPPLADVVVVVDATFEESEQMALLPAQPLDVPAAVEILAFRADQPLH